MGTMGAQGGQGGATRSKSAMGLRDPSTSYDEAKREGLSDVLIVGKKADGSPWLGGTIRDEGQIAAFLADVPEFQPQHA